MHCVSTPPEGEARSVSKTEIIKMKSYCHRLLKCDHPALPQQDPGPAQWA